jgi:hypothetical protein
MDVPDRETDEFIMVEFCWLMLGADSRRRFQVLPYDTTIRSCNVLSVFKEIHSC